MTTFSTLAALGMMPLLLLIYSQGLGSLQNAVPYTGITIALFMTLVPCGFGIALNHYKPKYSAVVIKVGPSFLLNSDISDLHRGGCVLSFVCLSFCVSVWETAPATRSLRR